MNIEPSSPPSPSPVGSHWPISRQRGNPLRCEDPRSDPHSAVPEPSGAAASLGSGEPPTFVFGALNWILSSSFNMIWCNPWSIVSKFCMARMLSRFALDFVLFCSTMKCLLVQITPEMRLERHWPTSKRNNKTKTLYKSSCWALLVAHW